MRARPISCCFSGHRPGKLPWGDDEGDRRRLALKERLWNEMEAANERGYRHFICGMANGCDLYFFDAARYLRLQHPEVTIEAAIPYSGQAGRWRPELRERYADRDIRVLDSRGASLGEGLIVLEAADMAQKGADMETIVARANQLIGKMRQHFMVDDLKFLRKGGRLSGAAAFAGTLLQIKPILQGDPEGKIVVLSKERGRKKAMDTLIQLYEEMVEDKSAPVGISHAAAPAEALHLATALRQAGCTGEILSVCHEPVTGAHVGPGMLALYFYSQTWR